jgi:hypothetical protein
MKDILREQNTKFMITEQSLDLTNEPFKRETPPRSNRTKEAQEMWDVHGHVHIRARIAISVYDEEIMYVLSHISKVCCRATRCHRAHASKRDCRNQKHCMIKDLAKLCSYLRRRMFRTLAPDADESDGKENGA